MKFCVDVGCGEDVGLLAWLEGWASLWRVEACIVEVVNANIPVATPQAVMSMVM